MRFLFSFIFVLLAMAGSAQIAVRFAVYATTGDDVLDKMYLKYKNAPCKRYTFSQKNYHYRNDSVIGNSEWHEYVEFPDKFRIDFEYPSQGNFVIFKNDSSYSYKNSELKKTKYNTNNLLLLLGGMYYRELKDVLARLKNDGYNTQMVSNQKWNKQKVYVIGANAGDLKSNQIWVNKSDLKIVRIIERIDGENTMDMTFDSYQKLCSAFTETKVTFKRNGKIEQVEEYFDIKAVDAFEKEIFK